MRYHLIESGIITANIIYLSSNIRWHKRSAKINCDTDPNKRYISRGPVFTLRYQPKWTYVVCDNHLEIKLWLGLNLNIRRSFHMPIHFEWKLRMNNNYTLFSLCLSLRKIQILFVFFSLLWFSAFFKVLHKNEMWKKEMAHITKLKTGIRSEMVWIRFA